MGEKTQWEKRSREIVEGDKLFSKLTILSRTAQSCSQAVLSEWPHGAADR